MIFSYNWLKDYIKGELPKPEKLAELLTMHSFEVEEIHPVKSSKGGISPSAKLFNGAEKVGKDYILDIDVLPNRGSDCFSHIGVARECAAITNSKLQALNFKLKEDEKIKAKDFVIVKVKNKSDCFRYTARVITNVKVGPSPKWIQERLRVCGLKPINNIVDIANYVMLETGQPLHAFNYDKIESIQNQERTSSLQRKAKIKNIIVRRAKKGEKVITLDNEKYNLDGDILIIADSREPLAVAGIKGGKKAEINKKTKTVVLESANFSQKVIRQSSKKLGLKTDASWRFEHGIDPNLTEAAINRATSLIQEIAKGKVASGLVDVYPKKVLPKRIKLDLNYVERLLGVKIPVREIKNILTKLEFKVLQSKQPNLLIQVPTFRLDVSLPEDLIEEIGRIYGYQKVPAVFPTASLIPPKRNFEIFWEDFTKNILKEAGFTEVYNYSFIGEKIADIFGYKKWELVELENPLSSDYKYLRPSLIPSLLKNVRENSKNFKDINIFELGKIFTPLEINGTKKKNKTHKSLTGFINKQLEKKVLSVLSTDSDFYTLKGIVDLLLNKLGISEIWYDDFKVSPEESKKSFWEEGRCAEIKVDSQEIGFLGEISSEILKKMKINRKVVLFDINFEELQKLCSEEHEYQPISQYPAAVRDIAVLVPAEVRVEEVLNKINAAAGSLIRDIDLFDIYEGKQLPAGKKNLAFHIVYQAENRTLKSGEIDRLQKKIIKALEKEPAWEVRK